MTKMTQKDFYNAIIARLNGEAVQVSDADIIGFVNGRIAQIDKKNASRKVGLTDTQKENQALGNEIVAFMAQTPNKEFLVSDLRKHFGVTSQKITPIMGKLVEAGRVVKRTDKRVNFYQVA